MEQVQVNNYKTQHRQEAPRPAGSINETALSSSSPAIQVGASTAYNTAVLDRRLQAEEGPYFQVALENCP